MNLDCQVDVALLYLQGAETKYIIRKSQCDEGYVFFVGYLDGVFVMVILDVILETGSTE